MPSANGATLTVGVVGAGLVSDLHLSLLAKLDGARLVGVADLDPARAEEKAARYGTEPFSSLDELSDMAQPDVVHLLTPPSTHAALCRRALEGDSHVYIEKPVSVSEEDAEAILRAARASNHQVCVGHCMIFDPLMRRARQLVRDGTIGDLVDIAVTYCFDPARLSEIDPSHWYHRLPGGHLEDLAAHPASLLLELIGEAQSVHTATMAPRQGVEGVIAVVSGTHAAGVLRVILGTKPEDVTMQIRGTTAMIRIDFSNMSLIVDRERGLPKKLARGVKNLEVAAQLTGQTVASTARFVAGRLDTTKGMHTLIREFHDRLRRGAPTPIGPERGLSVIRLIRRIWPQATAEAEAG